MLFGHTYQIKSEMRLSGGDIVKIKSSAEGRFITNKNQLINPIKERIEFETGERVVEVISFEWV